MDEHTKEHLRESPAVVTVPLILLAIPSVVIGWLTIQPLLFGDWFGQSIFVLESQDVVAEMSHHFESALGFTLHGFTGWPFWLMAAGFVIATVVYMLRPGSSARIKRALSPIHRVLERKYWFDEVYFKVFADGGRGVGRAFWRGGDRALIDGVLVNGSARLIGWFSGVFRLVQSGYLFHYAFAMIIGLIVILSAFVLF